MRILTRKSNCYRMMPNIERLGRSTSKWKAIKIIFHSNSVCLKEILKTSREEWSSTSSDMMAKYSFKTKACWQIACLIKQVRGSMPFWISQGMIKMELILKWVRQLLVTRSHQICFKIAWWRQVSKKVRFSMLTSKTDQLLNQIKKELVMLITRSSR